MACSIPCFLGWFIMTIEKIQKVKDLYTKAMVSFCAVICWIILLINVFQVLFRYLFKIGFVFTEDVTVIGMLWIMSVGISIGTLHHEHMMINVIDSIVSPKVLDVIKFIVDIILVFFGIGMVYFGRLSLVANKGFTQSMLGFDESFRYLPVVVGGVFQFFAGIECVLEQLQKWSLEKKESKK